MREFVYKKLIRDKILPDMIAHGEKPVHRVLTDSDYLIELRKKIVEESAEIDLEDADKLLGELADLQEVLDAMLTAIDKSPDELKAAQAKKNAKVGAFDQRIFLDSVAIPEDNPWIKYLEQHPDRYPEITDRSSS